MKKNCGSLPYVFPYLIYVDKFVKLLKSLKLGDFCSCISCNLENIAHYARNFMLFSKSSLNVVPTFDQLKCISSITKLHGLKKYPCICHKSCFKRQLIRLKHQILCFFVSISHFQWCSSENSKTYPKAFVFPFDRTYTSALCHS